MRRLPLLALTIVMAATLQGQPLPPFFSPGEVLRYRVAWKFLRLGTITVQSERDTTSSGDHRMRGIIEVESNPDLPFIHIEEYNESLIDLKLMRSVRYYAKHTSGDEVRILTCTYDDSGQTARYEERDGLTDCLLEERRIPNLQGCIEGTALFFYTRYAASERTTRTIPTFAQGSIGPTTLEFSPGQEDVEIDCWDRPVRTIKYSGFAGWTGASAAGVTGEFEGWISDDSAAIPIRAELKILLGSISVELESWSRPGWSPPPPGPPLSKF